MEGLIELAVAHLLVVEPPVKNRRERYVHVRRGLVHVHVAAHEVSAPHAVGDVLVAIPKELVRVFWWHVRRQRHDHVSHHHCVFARGTLPLGLGARVHGVYAPLDGCPRSRTPNLADEPLPVLLIHTQGVVEMRAALVDVLAAHVRVVDALPAVVVGAELADRRCLVFRDMRHA